MEKRFEKDDIEFIDLDKKGRKKKKKRKHRKRFLYHKVLRKKGKWPAPLYYFLLGLAIFLHVLKRILFLLILFCFLGGIALLIAVLPTVKEWREEADQIVSESTESDFLINESSVVYDSDGFVLATLREAADQEYLLYEDIPQDVIDAFVAVEDQTFWENSGIDLKGIFRVGLDFVLTGGEEIHGASTITQQLARNVYLTHEVSLERKGKEIFIALGLTEKYTKEQIMEYYVNDICYANGIYGIAGAAKAYFDESVDNLTLSEIAYLCAIPNRPTYYDPYQYPERALERRDKILSDMLYMGYITQDEYQDAVNEAIVIDKPSYVYYDYETTYAVDCAVRYLMDLDGFDFEYDWNTMDEYRNYQSRYEEAYDTYKHQLYTQGYRIYTSLDSDLCEELQSILDDQLGFDEEIQGAISVVDVDTGKVVALTGGRTVENEEGMYGLNRAYQSYRQPGSSLKPLVVYTPALMNGYTASTIVENIDVDKAKEKGVDVQSLTGAKMTLRTAVEKSRNGVAWQIFDWLTPKYGLSFLSDMHFANIVPDDRYNAASLGGLTYGVTTVEMAEAYRTLANHGDHVDATCIVSLLDHQGEDLYKDPVFVEVYEDKAADDMVDILRGVLKSGTAASLRWSRSSDMDAFAKTGTTNDSKDGWFCGATPYYSVSVWVGYDTPKELSSLYGSTYPGNIWKETMLMLTENCSVKSFERNYEDDSYTTQYEDSNYYSYLPGRDDSEVLSSGYTVGDYRNDRVIGEGVTEIIQKMTMMSGDSVLLQEMYQEGCLIIDNIYSASYTNEMQTQLDTAFQNAINRGLTIDPLTGQPVSQSPVVDTSQPVLSP